ncbi:hypothetical protein ACVBEQ_18875 [Nakamurella sp. GG22]
MTGQRTVDLHDQQSLIDADTAALLPSAALAGAQVRSGAEQVAGLSPFDRPRALVVVGAGANVDAALLTALIGDRSAAPVVASPTLPGWVGPLDIVVVFAAAVDDMAAAEAAAQASRRGARLIVRGPQEGPVAAAAGAALLDPQLSVTEALAAPGRLALLAAVAAAAGLYVRPDFAAAAEQLDAMAMACHPSSEFFVNPGLTLAEHLTTGTPLFIGTDPVADAIAAHATRSLAGLAGFAAGWLGSGQAAGSPPVLARASSRGGAAAGRSGPEGGDLFWDPYDDDQAGGTAGQQIAPVLVIGPAAASPVPGSLGGGLIGAGLAGSAPPSGDFPFGSGPPAPRSPLAAALEAALPRAMCIGPDELPLTGDAGSGLEQPAPGVPQRDAFTWTVSMLNRIDFAAVYLGLLTMARAPLDSPDGLGRRGRSASHLPGVGRAVTPRDDATEESEFGSWS